MNNTNFTEIIKKAALGGIIKKIVFSKACDKEIIKSVATPFSKNGEMSFQIEKFTRDNKAFHENLNLDHALLQFETMAMSEYMQTNVITVGGECEVKRSKSGTVHISDRIKGGERVETSASPEKTKKHILDNYLNEDFLKKLGICDKNGRIHDKMQSKYRQINRFLENVAVCTKTLARERTVYVYDLCSGKSYLSFAIYFYLHNILNYDVEMLGIDLKQDVIDYCNDVAHSCNMNGLKFICGDILKHKLEHTPDIVVSLHACDIATDIVLAHAIKSGAKTILSTPCCHHELFSKVSLLSEEFASNFSFALSHSMTAQRLCDTLTDSLRVKTLEAYGYKVETVELVAVDDTPKNLLLRAVLKNSPDKNKKGELEKVRRLIGPKLMLETLLDT